MKPDQFNVFLKSELDREARLLVVRTLSEALMARFHIRRQGCELVYLLANGRGRDNLEAVRAWVSDALPPGSRGGSEDMEALRRRMGSALSSIKEGL